MTPRQARALRAGDVIEHETQPGIQFRVMNVFTDQVIAVRTEVIELANQAEGWKIAAKVSGWKFPVGEL